MLVAWENWTGPSSDFYRSLGFSFRQMAGLIGKAKKLKREGAFGSQEFKAVRVEGAPPSAATAVVEGPCAAAEIVLSNGQVVRFSGVDHLVDFLKKSA